MKKLCPATFLLPALVIGILMLSSCSGGGKNDFITLDSNNGNISLRLGMSEDEVRATINKDHVNDSASELQAGIHFNWNSDRTQCLSFRDFGTYFITPTGLSVNNSAKADILPAYAKDKDIKIIQNDDSRIVLGKQVDGVNYTLTFRFYPDGDVKYISVTNVDQYTEDEADYP